MSKNKKNIIPKIVIVFSFLLIQILFADKKVTVYSGLDMIAKDNYKIFAGKNIGLICNHTSLDRSGKHIVDLLHEHLNVMAIFAPEHGFRGDEAAGASIKDGKDSKTGINIFSLYGKTKKPTEEMLKNIDILVYDIQDVGVRFYTYISTMTYCMEAAAENKIEFVVLDRPNPIRGDIIEGPMLNKKFKSFVGMHETPIRYGLTAGEFASFINEESLLNDGVKVKLNIIKASGWKRDLWYDETDLKWIAPSPNMPDLMTAIVYPGMCLLEGTNLSEGRGTNTPFLIFGAPWLDNIRLCQQLEMLNMDGIKFISENFTPIDIKGKAHNPKFENILCNGVRLEITDRNKYLPIETTSKILELIVKNHREKFKWKDRWINLLSGNENLRNYIDNNNIDELFDRWQSEGVKFKKISKKYFLY